MGDLTLHEAIYSLTFTMAAFIFNLALVVVFFAIGSKNYRLKNRSFGKLIIVVLIGNLITCVTFVLRHALPFLAPVQFLFFMYLMVFLSNTLLTYYFAKYLESYFEGEAQNIPKTFLSKLNDLLAISSIIYVVVMYVYKVPKLIDGTADQFELPYWSRMVIAFGYELYFLIYAFIFFIRRRKFLTNRAAYTVMGAFAVTVAAVALEILNSTGIQVNYIGPTLGLYLFYFGAETPDYEALINTLKELELEKKRADTANSYKSIFLANMSHEIRTPINAVLGMNEMIMRESKDDNILEYSANIQSSGRTLLSIINSILDFSKIEGGKMEIIPVRYNTAMVINDAINSVAERAKNKGLEFETDIDEGLPAVLLGDDVRIRQVIMNLLTNAVKYTEKGTVSFSVRRGEQTSREITLKVKVSDTGIGIRPEDMERLCESFERLDEGRNHDIEGTGLGMAIVGTLLKLMGSEIKIKSVYGEGSEFSFDLKQEILDPRPMGHYAQHNVSETKENRVWQVTLNAPEARVLVVDDTDMNLKVIHSMLGLFGIEPDESKSGTDAIEKMRNNTYDVVFLDHLMPIMDGVETLHKLNEEKLVPEGTAVIALTANAIEGAKEMYMKEGFDDYLSKPVSVEQLEKKLKEYLKTDE